VIVAVSGGVIPSGPVRVNWIVKAPQSAPEGVVTLVMSVSGLMEKIRSSVFQALVGHDKSSERVIVVLPSQGSTTVAYRLRVTSLGSPPLMVPTMSRTPVKAVPIGALITMK